MTLPMDHNDGPHRSNLSTSVGRSTVGYFADLGGQNYFSNSFEFKCIVLLIHYILIEMKYILMNIMPFLVLNCIGLVQLISMMKYGKR